MSQFTYQGDSERVYPDITVSGAVLVAQSGQTYDLDTAPDSLWVAVQSVPQAVSEPATPIPDQTPESEA